jgi:hypothetical protein
MFNSENAQKKWQPLLDHSDVAPISDPYRRAVTAALLENQETAMKEANAHSNFSLNESDTTALGYQNSTGTFDPILIALVRRAMPSLIAYDVCGVQPLSGPTGLIFAMKSVYKSAGKGATTDGQEALAVNKAVTAFSGDSPAAGSVESVAGGYDTARGEVLAGDANVSANQMAAMGFTIEKAAVEVKTRALKAGYTMELAQDLKAVHGLDAEAELANILSTEILAEINREVIGQIKNVAKTGSTKASPAGSFDFDDTAGDLLGARWGQEKFQALVFQIEKEANTIAQETRRGKGNYVIVSPNVGSALAASGSLNYSDSVNSSGLTIDSMGNTFAGTLNGSLKVYIDPYQTSDEVIVGYKGPSPYDAGIFYCPYVPLTMVKAVGEEDFQPRIAFKTRYGLANNPFVSLTNTSLAASNPYFRRFTVINL